MSAQNQFLPMVPGPAVLVDVIHCVAKRSFVLRSDICLQPWKVWTLRLKLMVPVKRIRV
jgi:hypothetical protein